jgi:hypothetical protein
VVSVLSPAAAVFSPPWFVRLSRTATPTPAYVLVTDMCDSFWVVAVVLDDQRLRNDICWSVFDC